MRQIYVTIFKKYMKENNILLKEIDEKRIILDREQINIKENIYLKEEKETHKAVNQNKAITVNNGICQDDLQSEAVGKATQQRME